MKKDLLFRLFALVAALSCVLGVSAYDFVSNGIYYTITGTRAVEVAPNPNQYTGSITIPSMTSYNGIVYQVSAIGESAFLDCTGLTDVTIPNSVTTIESNAFQGCSNLSSVVIGSGVTSIGDYAFNRTALPRVIIPASVTSIGDYAFSDCALSNVICLATTPPTIQSHTFLYSSGTGPGHHPATAYHVPKGCLSVYQAADYWKSLWLAEVTYDFEVNGIYYTITGDRTVEVVSRIPYADRYSGSINIPAMTSYNGTVYQVTAIADQAFSYCSDLTSVTIPNSVTTIGWMAFINCTALTSLTIPSSVISIVGDEVFAGCSGLTSIIVESGNPVYDSRNNCNAIIETGSNTLLTGCKNTVIPNTVTSIGSFAFFYCPGLTIVTIPNLVTNIGDLAFVGCSALTSVICLATTPPEIMVDTFSSTFDEETYTNATLTVPRGCKSAYEAAEGWQNFVTIKEISYDFMVNGICYNITGSNTVEVTGNPGKYSGNVGIPSSVAYNGTTYQVRSIGTYAFEACNDLTGVTIPNSVTSVGDASFTGCSNLTGVTIPNSVTYIGWFAFSYCQRLASVTIGSGVTSIGDYAFTECPVLRTVTCQATMPPSMDSSNVFDAATYSNGTLKVPTGCKTAYETANWWKYFTRIQELGDNRGDVNGDSNVNISDVTALINYLLSHNAAGVNLSAADCNQDTNITISDVTALINYLLSHHW